MDFKNANVHLYDLKKNNSRQVTSTANSASRAGDACWSPDSKTIYYVEDFDALKAGVLYRCDVDGTNIMSLLNKFVNLIYSVNVIALCMKAVE